MNQQIPPFLLNPRPDGLDGIEVAADWRHEQRYSIMLLDVFGDYFTMMGRVVVHDEDFIFQSDFLIKMLEKKQNTLSICGFGSREIYAISQI